MMTPTRPYFTLREYVTLPDFSSFVGRYPLKEIIGYSIPPRSQVFTLCATGYGYGNERRE